MITGEIFGNRGFGLPAVNFTRGGVVLAQARATALTGGTALTVPFPTDATSLGGAHPGLSAGAVDVQVYDQTGPSTYLLIGSTLLTVADTRLCTLCVTGIAPSSIDLATPPAAFSVAGQGFANAGFGLPVVNFARGGVVLAQARATALTGGTALTVPSPTDATSLAGPHSGLSAGPVDVQVYDQTRPSSYLLIGSTPLTATLFPYTTLFRSGIAPSSIDLATPPAAFSVAGQGFANAGFGLPVVNFARGGVVLAQARATALTGGSAERRVGPGGGARRGAPHSRHTGGADELE